MAEADGDAVRGRSILDDWQRGEEPPVVKRKTPIGAEWLLSHAFWVRDAKVNLDLPYVVKGLFGPGQIVVFWGAPGSGKTFVATEMACHVGCGKAWHGRRTGAGKVLYVLAESSRPYAENRIAALKREVPDLVDSQVLFIPLALDLLHDERGDVDRVIATAKHVADVSLVIVDTLSVTFGGGDENTSTDMGMYVSNIKRLAAEVGAAVLIVHHAGKSEAAGMRGHSALLGALDAELTIEGKPSEERILRTGKVRDGDGFTDIFAFTLRRVELGIDADGDLVTTCVVDSKDDAGTERVRRERKATGLGKNQKAVLRAVEAAGGRMSRIELTQKLRDEGLSRQRVHDALALLLDSGMLITHNGMVPEVALPDAK